LLSWSLQQAVERAQGAPSPWRLIRGAVSTYLDVLFDLLPVAMALGTLGLVLAEYTAVFTYLSYPFSLLLRLLAVPEATEAAPAMLVGFADNFLPAVLAKGIESELTRFVIACVSFTQLIYLTEIGVLLMRSQFKFNLLELFAIFLLRTLIATPVIGGVAHLVLS
jgi:nucleoside recognition membrane protein YjiH